MKTPERCFCGAEAIVENLGREYKVICTKCPVEHQAGPYRDRGRAIAVWDRMQEDARASA